MTAPTTDSSTLQAPNSTQIARSAILMISILAFAKVFSLSEKWIGLDRFGVGSDWGTYAVANILPEQLITLIAGGALSFAFIPVFSAMLNKGSREEAWKLASNVLNTVMLVALLVAIVAFIFAPWLVANVLAPGFARQVLSVSVPFGMNAVYELMRPDLVTQTASLMRILLLSLVIFSVSGLFSGILYTHQHFFLPAITPIMFDVGNLLGVAVLARYYGVYGAAIGAVIGSCLHLAIQIPGLIYYRAKWTPTLNWRNPELREVIRLMIPRSLALGLANINLLIASNIASNLSNGAAQYAALNRGWSLMQIPETLIGTAMGIVIFPTLALLSAAGDLKGKRAALSGSLRFILIASIPAAVAIVFAGRQFISILEGGEFNSEGVTRVYSVLQFWAIGIVTHSALEVVARSFFADKDTVTPLYASIVETVVYIGLGVIFVNQFGVAGLALANSLAVGVELVLLLVILRRRWHGVQGRQLALTVGKVLVATTAMALAMWIAQPVINSFAPAINGRLLLLLHGTALLLVGGIVYFAVALLLRMEELLQLPALIRRRVVPTGVASNAVSSGD